MRKIISSARGIALACLALVPILVMGSVHQANAGSRSQPPADALQPTAPHDHRSMLKIRATDRLPMHKVVRVGLNKSMMVELPRDVRDVIVSNPEILDAVVQSSNRVYLVAKVYGQANAFFFDAHGQQILTLEVTIEQDGSVLEQMLARLIPGSRIKVEMLNDSVILTGSVPTAIASSRARDIASRFIVGQPPTQKKPDDRAVSLHVRHPLKVINLLAVEGEEQVMLRVTVAEVQRELLKQLGVILGAMINSGNFAVRVLTENTLPLTAAAGLGKLPLPAIDTTTTPNSLSVFNGGPSPTSVGNSGIHGFWGAGSQRTAYALRALERNGLIRTLAEPNLTAISGETAKFLAGGEFPIPIVDSTGKTSVQFKEFGIGLSFTPFVLSEGRISLKIETEVSELTQAGSVQLNSIAIPALKKRQAKTTVEMPSGGSLAIAGLLSEESRQNVDGLPGLKDVPILGTLFRSRDYIKRETELVVIVSPYIVRPTSRQKLARPDDGLAPASDMKASFLGHLNRIYGKASTRLPIGGLKGDYGYIVD